MPIDAPTVDVLRKQAIAMAMLWLTARDYDHEGGRAWFAVRASDLGLRDDVLRGKRIRVTIEAESDVSQSFIKLPGDGCHSSLFSFGDALAAERPPCTVCNTPADKHGSYPTCASHPYTPDGNCRHVIGAKCLGAECNTKGCVRGAMRARDAEGVEGKTK